MRALAERYAGGPTLERVDVVARARAWWAEDPDPETRAQLAPLIDAPDHTALDALFAGRLTFGTAGLRGAMGPGPLRMNRLLVRKTATALGRIVGRSPIVIGYDARHKSREFAHDTAHVLAGLGITPVVLPGPLPTPVLAFAVRHLAAAAGVMVTASHNPPQDNGYKVYWGDGAQIVPPVDRQIEAAIDEVAEIPWSEDGIQQAGHDVEEAYLEGVLARHASATSGGSRDLRIVYTPLHGVGGATFVELFRRAGYPAVRTVGRQFRPDPEFPTVAFPNPEEPGSMDLALARAQQEGADIVLANDPDADRLAVAVPDPHKAAGWRRLTGDQTGVLLADQLLRGSSGSDRLVVTSIVSSSMLAKMAAAHGVHYAETLTGFKWIARAPDSRPGTRFLFGYEEALGYCVDDLVRDKDGLSAALAFAGMAATLKAEGRLVLDRLVELYREFGEHVTAQWAIATEAGPVMARLRASPPPDVADWRDLLPEADVVVLHLADGSRVVVRPSGTEPKIKLYFEAGSAARVADLRGRMSALMGLPSGQ